jgi:hypothetical protein
MNDKQLQLCSFEQAKRLKNVGFDWEVQCYYKSKKNNVLFFGQSLVDHNVDDYDYSAPSVALALKWFRDVKGIPSSVECDGHKCVKLKYVPFYIGAWYRVWTEDNQYARNPTVKSFNSYESAESALLDELLTLIGTEK